MTEFSIVIPVKKGKLYLEKSINSILEQTVQDYEIIVLTDSTTNEDGTLDWLKSLNIDNLRVIASGKELNIQENWERIRSIPKAPFFTILGYDDILYPNYLENMKDQIQKHPNATLYHIHFDFINETGDILSACPPMKKELAGTEFLESLMKCEYFIMASGYMMRSADYNRVGGMPTNYANLLFADYELWMRLTFLSYQVVSPEKGFAFRVHESTTKSSSENTMLKAFSQLVEYLSSLMDQPSFKTIIRQHGPYFLQYNCNSMAYRLIRRKRDQNANLNVAALIHAFEGFAHKLGLGNINLRNIRNIKIALLIDATPLTRTLYQQLKNIFPRPFLRSFPRAGK